MPGLVLARHEQETIVIGEGLITITVRKISASIVKICVEAPEDIDVWRGEVWERKQREEAQTS